MALILKSNSKLEYPSLEQLIGKSASLHLDFRNQSYKINGVPTSSISDVITVERKARSGKYDVFGNWEEVIPDDTPIISVDQYSYKKGLLIEAAFTNLLLNSKTPNTQTITVTVPNLTTAYILSVGGTGEAVLTVNGVVVGTAREGQPLPYLPDSTGSKTIKVEPVGSLSYYGFYSSVEARNRVTRPTSTTAAAPVVTPKASIKSTILADILGTNFSGCLVVRQFFPPDIFDRSKTVVQTGSITQIRGAGNPGIFVGRQENGGLTNLVRAQGSAEGEKLSAINSPLQRSNIYALNFSSTSAKLSANGYLSEALSFPEITPNRIYIGSGDFWSINVTNYIEEVLVFNSQLTDDELLKITSS